jgi:hypothetical protein
MDSAFQVVAITDHRASDGKPEVWVYAARTDTEEETLALAKQLLPSGSLIRVTPGFLYAPSVIEGHEIGANEMTRIW